MQEERLGVGGVKKSGSGVTLPALKAVRSLPSYITLFHLTVSPVCKMWLVIPVLGSQKSKWVE